MYCVIKWNKWTNYGGRESTVTKTLEEDANTWESAERFAKLSVKELYEPLIQAQIDAAVQDAEDAYAIPPQYTITVEIRN